MSALSEFEVECLDLDARDYSPRQIAQIVERGEDAVRQALASAAVKLDQPENVARRRVQLDMARAAQNFHTEEVPQVKGTGEAAEPFLRWRWSFGSSG